MTATDVLVELTARGVTLTPEGDRVRYRGPKGAMTPELLEQVTKHKPELLAFFKGKVAEVLPGPSGATDPILADAYRRYWTLPETEPLEVFQSAYREIARLEAKGDPAVAWATLRETATGYHAETGVCPFCREPGSLHLPAKRPDMEM